MSEEIINYFNNPLHFPWFTERWEQLQLIEQEIVTNELSNVLDDLFQYETESLLDEGYTNGQFETVAKLFELDAEDLLTLHKKFSERKILVEDIVNALENS